MVCQILERQTLVKAAQYIISASPLQCVLEQSSHCRCRMCTNELQHIMLKLDAKGRLIQFSFY